MLVVARVKMPSFGLGAGIQNEMSCFNEIYLFIVDDDRCLALKDADRVLIGIESIQAVLQDFCGHATLINTDVVVLADIGGLHHSAALVDFDFGIRKTGV